jgi:transcriptional regulator with GAF, ATPase, and Fis domain
LENLIERAVVLSNSKIITRANLPHFLLKASGETEDLVAGEEEFTGLKEQTQNFQKRTIIKAMKRAKGVQKIAAKMLGIKPTTLNEMIKRLEIDIDSLFE